MLTANESATDKYDFRATIRMFDASKVNVRVLTGHGSSRPCDSYKIKDDIDLIIKKTSEIKNNIEKENK